LDNLYESGTKSQVHINHKLSKKKHLRFIESYNRLITSFLVAINNTNSIVCNPKITVI